VGAHQPRAAAAADSDLFMTYPEERRFRMSTRENGAPP
jgi:hypothetical protein